MRTWQSNRHKKRHIPQPNAEALRQKRARAESARMSQPPPVYPQSDHWRGYVLWCIDGVTTRVDLYRPARGRNRARCDSYEARIGDRVLTTGGLHEISRQAIAEEIPRTPSIGMLASLSA